MFKIIHPSRSWIAYAFTFAIFMVDTHIELGVAAAALYVVAVWSAYLSGRRDLILKVAVISTVLVFVGWWLSPAGGTDYKVELNRLISIVAIWVTALPCCRVIATRGALDDAIESAAEADRKSEEERRRERAMTNMLEDLHIERRKFVEVTKELSFPLGDSAVVDTTASLKDLSLTDMFQCGAALRQLTRQHESASKYMDAHVNFMYQYFRDENDESEFALVRLYRTQTLNQLDIDTADVVRGILPNADPETKCLVLVATRGELEEWNDTAMSRRHRAVPIECLEGRRETQDLAEVLRQVGVLDSPGQNSIPCRDGLTPEGCLFEPTAPGSSCVGDLEEFVPRSGIESVIGYGGKVGYRDTFILMAYSKKPISPTTAELFFHLRYSTCIGLTAYEDSSRSAINNIRAVEQLLQDKVDIVIHQEARLRNAMSRLEDANANLVEVNEELEKFAYVAAHDLRSPLRGIANTAAFIREDDGDRLSKSSFRHLDRMEGRIQRMESLLKDLLAYSRVGRKEDAIAYVDTRQLVKNCVELLAIPERIEVRLPREMPQLETYVTPLRHVLLNLVGNAIKHGGDIIRRIDIEVQPRGDRWEFSVADDGPGIEPEFHEQVFEMFRTLQSRDEVEGSGMGLAIIRKQIRHFGGDIQVESELGKGTKFTFTWPNGINTKELAHES